MRPLVVLFCLVLTSALAADPATVQVQSAPVYAKPTPTSDFLGKLPAGTVLTVEKEQAGWALVRSANPKLEGWIRAQSYTVKAVNTKASGNVGGTVSATEVSLAGRGFSEALEQDYRTANPTLNYGPVDRLEQNDIPDDELDAFLRDGGIHPVGGR